MPLTRDQGVATVDFILHILILAGVIFFVAESMRGVHIEGYGTAIIVALVYSLINIVLGTVLAILTLPLMIITVGLFKFVINSFLLWITDQMIDDFEIEDFGTTFLLAIIITLADTALAITF
jgi:putative membrane protein